MTERIAYITTSPTLRIPVVNNRVVDVYFRENKRENFKYMGVATNGQLISSSPVTVPEVFFAGLERRKRDALYHFSGYAHLSFVRMDKEFYTYRDIIQSDPIFNWDVLID